jgi:hypothetical protein
MGALLIVDEMITGFGRTGKYWGAEHSGVEPDIVTIGKQFGGGMPITGVISKDEIVNAKPWSNPSGSSSSYGGNPLASAGALAALNIIDDEGLVENSSQSWTSLLGKLESFAEEYPFVGDVRGTGLLIAIEMVKDRTTKEPLSKKITYQIFDQCLKRGLLTMSYESTFRIQPAMTIDEQTVDNAVTIIREVFDWLRVKRSGSEDKEPVRKWLFWLYAASSFSKKSSLERLLPFAVHWTVVLFGHPVLKAYYVYAPVFLKSFPCLKPKYLIFGQALMRSTNTPTIKA